LTKFRFLEIDLQLFELHAHHHRAKTVDHDSYRQRYANKWGGIKMTFSLAPVVHSNDCYSISIGSSRIQNERETVFEMTTSPIVTTINNGNGFLSINSSFSRHNRIIDRQLDVHLFIPVACRIPRHSRK
jgi:hypothetical protein